MCQPGEIYYATNAYGSEPHRVVVVSRAELNRGSYAVVVPFTTKRFAQRRDMPHRVPFLAGEQEGLDEDCIARAEMINTIELANSISMPAVLANSMRRRCATSYGRSATWPRLPASRIKLVNSRHPFAVLYV